jgi:hypothetical protein
MTLSSTCERDVEMQATRHHEEFLNAGDFNLLNEGYRIRSIRFLIKNNFPRNPFTVLFALEWTLIYSHSVERVLQARVPVIEERYQLPTNYSTD